VRITDGQLSVVEGPFVEAKEVIGGYAIFELPGKEEGVDHLRRGRMFERKHEMITWDMEEEQQAMPDLDSALDDDIGDGLLRLIFTACNPRLSREARAALVLRMICGLTTEEIARAYLVPNTTIA
jgi:predicted RNA polymerase sigma factor